MKPLRRRTPLSADEQRRVAELLRPAEAMMSPRLAAEIAAPATCLGCHDNCIKILKSLTKTSLPHVTKV